MFFTLPIILVFALAVVLLLAVLLIRGIFAKAADRKKLERLTEFLSIASHHLRTPMTLIKWTLTEFLEGNYGKLSDDQKRLFHDLVRRNEQLIRFVHSLLDVTRVEAGRVELHFDRVVVAPLLEETVFKLQALAKDYHVSLTGVIPGNLPRIVIDPEAIARVLENIIENAIIYNKKGGAVEIKAEARDGSIVIIVRDTGIGISKEEIVRIGEKFFRTQDAKKQVAEGTGLGVFSAREILKMHYGDLAIESEEGEGTTMTITLPIKSPHENIVFQKERDDIDVIPRNVPVADIKKEQPTPRGNMTVLLIDDDPVMRELLAQRFASEHIVMATAEDGEKGIIKAEEVRPDLILLNMLLPGRDGFSVLGELKKNSDLAPIPVVVLSNLAQREEVQKGLSMGAELYLVKTSYTPAQIVDEVKKVFLLHKK
ncbi:MAG: hybrid sensor histidine kinase/response regulator [Candidatus Niyogibacteria bacterium]|nr:hybrid sensor histidine kinase/response regulator [Candidatus Niyogibacteria bacterium]